VTLFVACALHVRLRLKYAKANDLVEQPSP
jgi:hypothetical protein